MHRLNFAVVFLVASFVGNAADFGRQFVTARLDYGASVSVPTSWQILRGNEMRAIGAGVGAAIDLAGYSQQLEGGETLIVASFPDPKLYASMTLTTLSTPSLTSAVPVSMTDAQIKAGEATIRKAVEAVQARLGTKVYGWSPLRKTVVGRNTVMYTSYLRSSTGGERRVHLYKFFGSGRIYDLALSTSVAHESLNGVVLEKIAHSLVVP